MAPSQILLLLAPLLLVVSGFAVTRSRLHLPRIVAWFSVGVAVISGISGGYAPVAPAALVFDWGWVELGVRADALSLIVFALVSWIGAQTLRFSESYLEGDPRHAGFVRTMAFTLAAVQSFALSPSLSQLILASMAVSAGLHRLLLHYPERPGAREAAWTKFAVSRLGDTALVAALFLVYRGAGTSEFSAVFERIRQGDLPTTTIGLLIAVGVLCKSAQLPFHTWLPETLETPTPVSAFMHAGVVNAGGFLAIRLHPIFEAGVAASSVLAIVGVLTAAYGAVVMLAQTTIKRALAYSTIAQMGFMVLQCGLGAYSLALLHIVAHALYKSGAFLRSGSHVFSPPRAAVVLPYASIAVGVAVAALLALTLPWTLPAALTRPEEFLFALVLLGACAYSVARFHAVGGFSTGALRGYGLALATFGLGATLHAAVIPLVPVSPGSLPLPVTLTVATLFLLLLAFQFSLARIHLNPWMRHLYVHASHGFYFAAWLNRHLRRFLPIPASA